MLVDFIICNPCRMIAKRVKGHVDCCNYFSHIVYLPYEMLPAGRSQVQASLKKSLSNSGSKMQPYMPIQLMKNMLLRC